MSEVMTHIKKGTDEVTYKGKTQTFFELEKELGFRKGLIVQRLRQGMDLERACTMPVKKRNVYKTIGDTQIKVQKTDLERRLSDNEIEQLLTCFTPKNFGKYAQRNLAITIILLNLGIRLGELVGIVVGDVLNVDGSYKEFLDLRSELTKGNKNRQVAINSQVKLALDILINKKEANFNTKLVTVSPRQVRQIIENASHRAGLNRVISPHCLRHTALTNVYNKTKNIAITKLIAGHSSANTTISYYVNPTWEEMTDAMEGLYAKKEPKEELKEEVKTQEAMDDTEGK